MAFFINLVAAMETPNERNLDCIRAMRSDSNCLGLDEELLIWVVADLPLEGLVQEDFREIDLTDLETTVLLASLGLSKSFEVVRECISLSLVESWQLEDMHNMSFLTT